jgi:hypothetical protein
MIIFATCFEIYSHSVLYIYLKNRIRGHLMKLEICDETVLLSETQFSLRELKL